MTIYVVYHGGNGTSGVATTLAPSAGEWATAFQTLAAALAVATASDTIVGASDHDESTTSATTYTWPGSPGAKQISVDRSTGVLTKGATTKIGAASVAMALAGYADIEGWRFQGGTNSSNSAVLNVGTLTTTGHGLRFTDCDLHVRASGSSPVLQLGLSAATGVQESYIELIRTDLGVTASGQRIAFGAARIRMLDCGHISGSGAPTTLFRWLAGVASDVEIRSCDFSSIAWSNFIESTTNAGPHELVVVDTPFASGAAVLSGSLEGPGSPEITLINSGGVSFLFQNAMGTLTLDTTVKVTGTPAGFSWSIATTSLCSRAAPFFSPWIRWEDAPASSVTPYFEVLRDGSTTAYTDAQVAAQFTHAQTFYTDAAAANASGTNQAAGIGTSSWEGEGGSAWSGKCDAGSAFTPSGPVYGRIVATMASATVKVEPLIRT